VGAAVLPLDFYEISPDFLKKNKKDQETKFKSPNPSTINA